MSDVINFVKAFIKKAMDEDITGMSAQLAYYFLLSLFPLLLFTLTLAGYLPIDKEQVMGFLEAYTPPNINELITTNVDTIVDNQNSGLLSISILGTLWAASNGINALIRAFNTAYDVKEERSFIVTRLIAIVLTLAMIVVIIVALLLPVFGKLIGEYIFGFIGLSDNFIAVWDALRWIISSAVFFIVFLALYRLAPSKKIKLKNVVWGALFATVSWQAASLLFSYYVSNFGNYSATYGTLGAVIVLMIWFFISGIIIVTGGVLNAFIRERQLRR